MRGSFPVNSIERSLIADGYADLNVKASFPSVRALWEGSILHTIFHAVFIMAYPELSHEVSWDGKNYNRQNSSGARGTVTFDGNRVVGAFFDAKSPRSPYHALGSYNLEAYFAGIPSDLLQLAREQTLQYVLDDFGGIVVPVITAAFWAPEGSLTAVEPWSAVIANGAHLVAVESQETAAGFIHWTDEYGLLDHQVELIESLFSRKIATPSARIPLTQHEIAIMQTNGNAGEAESTELLSAIGFDVP